MRSGGHSWAAWSVREGAILIDMGRYYDFTLDEKTGVLQVSPSMTGRMVNTLLGQRGRMFPGGHCPDVGLGGFVLQGGMGWNCKNWGFACEKLVGIDVVTAVGEKMYCNRETNSDLFWAARGAGPGFPAVVTRFYLQTLPAFTHMRSSVYIYEMKDFETAVGWIVNITADYDDSVEIVAVGQYVQGLEGPHVIVKLVTFQNSEEEARFALKAAEDTVPGNPVVRAFCQETSLAAEYDDQHSANPAGHRYTVDNCYIRNDADVVSVLKQRTLPLERIEAKPGDVVVALDRVRDPGNLGTVIRTADAVGAKAVVLVGETTDPFGLEAVRATMGSLFAVPLVRSSEESFIAWRGRVAFRTLGTHLKGTTDFRKLPKDGRPTLLLMGNEAQGLPEALEAACDVRVKLPMLGKADSLNAAVATAVMAYEVLARQER